MVVGILIFVVIYGAILFLKKPDEKMDEEIWFDDRKRIKRKK